MNYFSILIFFKKSLILKIRLFLFLLFFISFCSFSKNLKLDNNNLICNDISCDIFLKENQEYNLNKINSNVIEVLENKKLLKYYFYTTDIEDIPAYSGKPLEILISLTKNGLIDDLKLIKHSEPILLTGIPIEKLLEAICLYKGKDIGFNIGIGVNKDDFSIPIISGATVTSLVLHKTILGTSRNVFKSLGLFSNDFFPKVKAEEFKYKNWNDLFNDGAIGKIKAYTNDIPGFKSKKNKLLVDIYFADITHPTIGINLIGKDEYSYILEKSYGKPVILILNNGKWSFKGSGFVRGEIFDRFRIEQGLNVFTFKYSNYIHLYGLECIDVNNFKEHGLFIVDDVKYNVFSESNFVFLINYIKNNNTNYSSISSFYKVPYYKVISNSIVIDTWKNRLTYVFIYLFFWLFVILIFVFRVFFTKNNSLLSFLYILALILSFAIIGIIQSGQPSIVNLLAFLNNFKNAFNIFILDPYIFIGWLMISFTIFLWGKSLFCGWICPFGSLQELLFKFKNFLFNDYNLDFPNNLRYYFKYIKYIVFLIILFVSFYDFKLAELLSEIEPFKTIWNIGILNRGYYSIYCFSLLFLGLFIYRFFCRYLCPLGASLSLLSFFQFYQISRRKTCSICKICRNSCISLAINDNGIIDKKECYACFNCIHNMYNNNICPPLISKKIWDRYES